MSTDGTVALPEELQNLAAALFVPPAWLAAPDEATAAAAAVDPAWTWAWSVTLPNPPALPSTPDDMPPVVRWQRELSICWRSYLNQGRTDALDKAIVAMLAQPTADGRHWPRFHRSVAMQEVTEFSSAQQHALGMVLCPQQTPPHAEIAAQVQAIARFRPFTSTSVLCPPEWPLEPKSGSYGRLLGELERVREGRLAGKPVADDRFPNLIVDQVVEVMVATFRCHFPDDAELDLLTAVRAYRYFRKQAYVSDAEQDEHRPDRGREVWELWERLPVGRIINKTGLEKDYDACGFPTCDLVADIITREQEGHIKVRRFNGQTWVLILPIPEWDPVLKPIRKELLPHTQKGAPTRIDTKTIS
jgi:hypothetical protein